MGAPLTASNSASTTLAGNVVTRAGAAGGAVVVLGVPAAGSFFTTGAAGGSGRVSSLEPQLETPKAANSDSTTIVKARRAGVQSVFPVSIFLFSCIISLTTPTKTERVENDRHLTLLTNILDT